MRLSSESCDDQDMIRFWFAAQLPGGDCGGAERRIVATYTLDYCPRTAQAALRKMSSQAKVKKDKEIIAEYETQVKGGWRAGPVPIVIVGGQPCITLLQALVDLSVHCCGVARLHWFG